MNWFKKKAKEYIDNKIMNDPKKFRKCLEKAYGPIPEVRMVKGECENVNIKNCLLIDSTIKTNVSETIGNVFLSNSSIQFYRQPRPLQQRMYLASKKVKRRV
ncbi:hypothetical protein [Bacillus phage SPO1L4]|nr:hypothetical protein [Bacillus phage SPO1L3]WIT26570.1 hypothetical protein [Bacillus phage SPO1L4]WIT26769.1 hypothetical protein [Bacillus phage SPO1L5]